MKLGTKELEQRILKHLIKNPKAVTKAKGLNITPNHFVYKEEGISFSVHNKIYHIVDMYFEQSNGSLLTELVLENKLIEFQVKDEIKTYFLLAWEQIQEQDYDENEFHDLISQLKKNKAVRMWADMHQSSQTTMVEKGLQSAVQSIQEKVNEIQEEMILEEELRQTVDIGNSADYVEKEYTKRLDHPELYQGIKCGLDAIDSKLYGWQASQLVVVMAPSSGGKSIQMLNWANYAFLHEKKNVLYFSFEMDAWLCTLRHISLLFKIPFYRLKGMLLSKEEVKTLVDEINALNKDSYFEYDVNLSDPTPQYVDSRIRELTLTKGKPDLVVCDYIGNMYSRNSRKNAPPWEKQGDAAVELHQLAKKHGVAVLTAQQINRETIRENSKLKGSGKAVEYRQDAMSGDQRLFHLCTHAIGLEPDKENSLITYHHVKQRELWFAPFIARLDTAYNGVIELSPEEQENWKVHKGLTPPDKPEHKAKNKREDTTNEESEFISMDNDPLVLDTTEWDA